jgi:hypothetical protein
VRILSPSYAIWEPTPEEVALFMRDRAVHWLLLRAFVHLDAVLAGDA